MENILYRGTGYAVVETDGKMKVCWSEGLEGTIVYHEITEELFEKLKKSEKDAYDVMMYCKTGQWPLNDIDELEKDREFIRNCPELLLTVPENQKLFDEDELQVLLQKAREQTE